MFSIGIDSGSSTTKGILFDGHEILETRLIPTGANPKRAMQSLYNEFKQIADLKETQVLYSNNRLWS